MCGINQTPERMLFDVIEENEVIRTTVGMSRNCTYYKRLLEDGFTITSTASNDILDDTEKVV